MPKTRTNVRVSPLGRFAVRLAFDDGARFQAENFFCEKCSTTIEKSKGAVYNAPDSKREVINMIYAKTALEGYTKVEDVIEIMDESFLKKAIVPYGRYKTAEKQAEELIGLIEKKKRLIAFYSDITTAVHGLKSEHRRLLEEKYGMVGGGVSDEQNRNYYRKLLLATRKFALQMEELGYDEEKYQSLIKEFYFLDEIYYDKKRKERPERKIGVLHNLAGESLKDC